MDNNFINNSFFYKNFEINLYIQKNNIYIFNYRSYLDTYDVN